MEKIGYLKKNTALKDQMDNFLIKEQAIAKKENLDHPHVTAVSQIGLPPSGKFKE